MKDKTELLNDLREAFIEYQWRQENPFPFPDVTVSEKHNLYMNDHLFHRKVDSLVCGVMSIIDKHI